MIDKSPIPFETFMQRALHDPERGYYARRIPEVGRHGDFTTAPMLSKVLAQAIAGWVVQSMQETGCRDLIELGPGQGRLAADVLSHLPWRVRWKTRLHLVETSQPLREHQQKLLGTKAAWHSCATDALAACDGKAILFSNELVDAFPVRCYQRTDEGWQELAVSRNSDGSIAETLLPATKLPDSSSFSQPHPVGQRIEVHESYRQYLQEWLPAWEKGRMLTIDYGSQADRLYFRRPRGTLRGYLHHQRLEGLAIYQNPGRQDLTADVNFTDLQPWSAPWVDDQRLMSLGDFVRNFQNHDDPSLSDPMGAGGAFLVLDQRAAPTKKP